MRLSKGRLRVMVRYSNHEVLDRCYGVNDVFGRGDGSFNGMTICWLSSESCERGLGRTI